METAGHLRFLQNSSEIGKIQLCKNCNRTNIAMWLNLQGSGTDAPSSALLWERRYALPESCELCRFILESVGESLDQRLTGQYDAVEPTQRFGQPYIERRGHRYPLDYKLELISICHGSWTSIKLDLFVETIKSRAQRVYSLLDDNPLPTEYQRGNHHLLDGPLPTEYQRGNHHLLDGLEFVPVGSQSFGCFRERSQRLEANLVKYWMNECRLKHKLCQQTLEDYPVNLVLIDANNWCLYQVLPGETPPYVALSYVWGEVEQPQLSSDLMESWQQEAALKSLEIPQTIHDAISLTTQIGLRYIWVDSLCICKNDYKKRQEQINQMFLIYSQSSLTIIAAYGSNCKGGLPGVDTTIGGRDEPLQIYKMPGFSLAPVYRDPEDLMSKEIWRTRGWTFQEELCSSRALIFLGNLIFFSCPEAVWREDIHLEEKEASGQKGLNFIRSFLSRKSMTRSGQIEFFRELVNEYLQRNLTCSEDIENAFMGIAGLLKPVIGPVYHGIPESTFAEIINGCWFWDEALERRAGFPSWSWVGYQKGGITPAPSDLNDKPILNFFGISDGVHSFRYNQDNNFLHPHFEPNILHLKSKYEELTAKNILPDSKLIAFFTSAKTLEVRTFLPPTSLSATLPKVVEYRIFAPGTRSPISSIHLPPQFIKEFGKTHQFIVIGNVSEGGAFRLMLIRWAGIIAYKVNVTIPGKLVRAADWWGLIPEKMLIVMS